MKKLTSLEQEIIASMLTPEQGIDKNSEFRSIGLFGEIDEEKSGGTIQALLERNHVYLQEKTNLKQTIDFYISTRGGSAEDMFAIYDTMQIVKKSCRISTIGLGKVMSAGVLLLAAGSKGKRKIGQNCRLMIHSVIAGNEGTLPNLENELEETKLMQSLYIKALRHETRMSEAKIKRFLDKKLNNYLSAEDAIQYGIVDEVI